MLIWYKCSEFWPPAALKYPLTSMTSTLEHPNTKNFSPVALYTTKYPYFGAPQGRKFLRIWPDLYFTPPPDFDQIVNEGGEIHGTPWWHGFGLSADMNWELSELPLSGIDTIGWNTFLNLHWYTFSTNSSFAPKAPRSWSPVKGSSAPDRKNSMEGGVGGPWKKVMQPT